MSFTRWRGAAGGFVGWSLSGCLVTADGKLALDPQTAAPGHDPYPPGTYFKHNYYNGSTFFLGEAASPVLNSAAAWSQAIASWEADTPPGTWIETQVRARFGTRWTKWYSLGVWAASSRTVERHSVSLQKDADGSVAVDTLKLSAPDDADGCQVKVRLLRSEDTDASPRVHSLSLMLSPAPHTASLVPGDPARWGNILPVPPCSQMAYPDGGEAWCSPAATAMLLAYWRNAAEPCEALVRAAVEGVFDWNYDGHGNWPFNTAYAATQGLEAYVARFTSFAQAEHWVAASVPVVMSYPWKKGALTGAPIPSSRGHLAVLVGFNAAGNPVVNDPAAASDVEVQRTYNRRQLETLWLENSGGTVYLIYPAGHRVPDL